jgi:hypothetical protein
MTIDTGILQKAVQNLNIIVYGNKSSHHPLKEFKVHAGLWNGDYTGQFFIAPKDSMSPVERAIFKVAAIENLSANLDFVQQVINQPFSASDRIKTIAPGRTETQEYIATTAERISDVLENNQKPSLPPDTIVLELDAAEVQRLAALDYRHLTLS